jgi:hypothetical protein
MPGVTVLIMVDQQAKQLVGQEFDFLQQTG